MVSIKTILCPTDFSEPAQGAFKAAVSLASSLGAALVLVNVIPVLPALATDPNFAYLVPEYELQIHADADEKLRKLAQQVPKPIIVRTIVGHGDAGTEIVRTAENEHADLIVMATQGMTGLPHLVFGSVAEKVVRLAKCPVLTTRAQAPEREGGTLFKTILCPTDFSEPAQEAFRVAVSLASDLGAGLELVHVVPDLPLLPNESDPWNYTAEYERLMRADADEKLRNLAQQVPQATPVRTLVGKGDPATEVVRIAEEEAADLIVIATHGVTGFRHLVMGSVAEKVVRLAKRPVLTVRPRASEAAKPERMQGTTA